jgi:glucosamine 6-phosphate synthetase-like amidotransferase/phosphosugar isomerase protein
MCAIFSAKSFDEFNRLYKQNQQRGNAATSWIYQYLGQTIVKKVPGIIDFETAIPKEVRDKVEVFVGHVQAPTSTAQSFNEDTSHPFICKPWIVAHNGVLTNFDDLKKGISKENYNEVDSSIIPALLSNYSTCNNYEDTADHIIRTLGRLRGTHSTWLYHYWSNSLYIARCGSTLYGNLNTGSFSSTPAEGMEELKDGNVYLVRNGLKVVGTFDAQSPFFIL